MLHMPMALFKQNHYLDPPCGSHKLLVFSVQLSVVASVARTRATMLDVLWLINFSWCVPLRQIENA